MKQKKKKTKGSSKKGKDLWKNPSYKNMLNPYESKYPQPKKK
jgi:hypothetical protein